MPKKKGGKDKDKTIVSMLQEERKFPPTEEFSEKAHVKSLKEYQKMWKRSVEDPEGFWAEQAENLEWMKKWDTVRSWDPPNCKWFEGGKLNVSVNCLDRHVDSWKKNKAALIWEGEPGEQRVYTYHHLWREVGRFANVLKEFGVEKGDRVIIYLPMIPELPIAMLACARIGAVHSIVFGGFSAEALWDRIEDCKPVLVITSD
jgi:acetyl-CoA synthetase